jgi:hypothetical protein
MNIVELSEDDIMLEEAARMANRSTKTVRRAVQDGLLPRRYVMGPRGPQLVFQRPELDRWLEVRSRRSSDGSESGGRGGASREDWAAFRSVVLQLHNTLEESRASIAHIGTRLHDQHEALSQTQASISALAERLSALEMLAREDS